MKYYLGVFFLYTLYYILNGIIISASADDSSLKLVVVLFRHGNRTPNGPEELYPKDPYRNEKYHITGIGQLTQAGKQREYEIGTALRERYDNFLGPYYMPEMIEPTSTAYNRTKASLLLALAGLFPPRGLQMWNQNIFWQPIPYNYLPEPQDKVLQGVLCPHYVTLYKDYINTPQVQNQFQKYRSIFDYISKHSGLNASNFEDMYNLFFGLRAEEDYGFKLPKWTTKVWPKIIETLAVKQYFIYTGTHELKQLITGYFIEKVIEDISQVVDGFDTNKKIYLYSAHELNVATFLIALGAFDPPHIPNYGAYVTLEVHKKNGIYGIEAYYQNYIADKPVKLRIKNCEGFCPFDRFKEIMDIYIPACPDFCYE